MITQYHQKGKKAKVANFMNILFVLFFFYLVYCGTLFFLQRKIMYPRHLIPVPNDMTKGNQAMETIWLHTSIGDVEAWYLPPAGGREKKQSPAVIFAHGNGELIDFWPAELAQFTHMGIGLFLVEYPGYGRSQGSPSEKNIAETFVNAYDYLIGRDDIDPSRIILFGRSLGGGAVCKLAEERASAALILLSAFTSARSFAPRFLVPGLIVRDPFDNISIVSSYANPILVIHGKKDTIVPYSHGVRLYRAAQKGKMITYPCGHNDCPSDWGIFWRDIAAFLHETGIIENG